MFRLIDIAPFHGILMNIIQLLAHNLVGFDDLRMISFFPNLIGSLRLVGAFKKRQQFQKLGRALLFQGRYDLLGRVGFETLHVTAQIPGSGDEMQVIFEDDAAVKPEARFPL